ncbi:UDP-N-acetylglucosamine diphosphorylase/glucosamine-1-phosphate N-acetyltransferase [Motiliproteus coralliicola]|uniref:Bifunctional protein GlmU n=1 Tax=Motiliproteus coralliicola TaxID=2283196 RepID=A0A369WBY6_9GAMM|nr:bifunctional UDP-N-acetylglucosamine diphosphorylase/glucosamine-1-phosphate N-acetyltransferase GlmU [Motiliproteus coralliicola]RDE18831.1 UDP-N-acetylglucosamine diphosphorylase/glucosamine-1-phosphate N-acetyltransferase [Motiliproteus coralliicola]
MSLEVIILAAGQGTRMKSKLPKVLHPIAGKPMVGHVIDTAARLDAAVTHVVVGHGSDQLRAYLDSGMGQHRLNVVEQTEQLGTGHAVDQAIPDVADDAVALILYGDVPLTQYDTLKGLVNRARQQALALLTVDLADPTGYGRIVRDHDHQVVAIVEHKDASEAELAIREINTGILALPAAWLKQWLPQLSSDNAQGEYYLTDIIAMAAEAGKPIEAVQPSCEQEVQGVNNRLQLAELERWHQLQQADHWMTQGVTLADPARVDFRGDIEIGNDSSLDVNVIMEGKVRIGSNVSIGANCVIKDSTVADGTQIKPNSMLDESEVGENCDIGPFARLRPGTKLAAKAKIGNFVETKKTLVGEGSKINHLSYVGDAILGSGVNVGAGTITCNYDGVNKFQTEIGDNAFIGSNSSLVAPVRVGEGATTGAGSTITKSIDDGALGVARGRQANLSGWKRPEKKA